MTILSVINIHSQLSYRPFKSCRLHDCQHRVSQALHPSGDAVDAQKSARLPAAGSASSTSASLYISCLSQSADSSSLFLHPGEGCSVGQQAFSQEGLPGLSPIRHTSGCRVVPEGLDAGAEIVLFELDAGVGCILSERKAQGESGSIAQGEHDSIVVDERALKDADLLLTQVCLGVG